MIPVEKMSKKARRAYYSSQRVRAGFNTGERDMKSAKYPSRQKLKREIRNFS